MTRMKRIISWVKAWNEWRKHNLNGRLHKFLVLIRVVHSPTFDVEWGFRKGLEENGTD